MTEEPMVTGTMEQVLEHLHEREAFDEASGRTYVDIRFDVPDLLAPTLQEMKRHKLLHNAPFGNKSRWWLADAGMDWLIAQAEMREAAARQPHDEHAVVHDDECHAPTADEKLNAANRTIFELMEHHRGLLEQINALRDDNAALAEMLDIERSRCGDVSELANAVGYVVGTGNGMTTYGGTMTDAADAVAEAREIAAQANVGIDVYGLIRIGTAKPVMSTTWEAA